MRVFISADIEGVTTTALWEQCNREKAPYKAAAQQMTDEVKAACQGALDAGADYILVKDAHASGTNIDISQLQPQVEVVRASCGSPWSMVYGIDKSFDAAMFVGYHSAAGRSGNPLSHTETRDTVWVTLNGVKCSEFRIFSLACALLKVPTVFLSGDKMLCEDSASIHPMLRTVAVKDGFGGLIRAIHPALACRRIREGACLALRQDLSSALCEMPSHFDLAVCYKEHTLATRMSFYPGCSKIDDNVVHFETTDYWELLRTAQFIL